MENFNKQDYWIKKLSNDKEEVGTDLDIQLGKASWTKGRQDLISAELKFSDRRIFITSSPETKTEKWTQVDHCLYNTRTNKTDRFARTIGCSFLNVSKVAILRNAKGDISFFLNNEIGDRIPSEAKSLECKLFKDGKIEHRWR